MSSRRRIAVALVGVVASMLVASSSFAQIIYEPVQYQYSANGRLYYYGGSDPRMHRYVASNGSPGGTWGAVNGYDFVSGDLDRHREVSFEKPARVFSDVVGYQNAAFYGYTARDAMNDAMASMPLYFRMSDVLRAGHRDETGALIVPATAPLVQRHTSAGTITITPMTHRPATTRTTSGPVIIFPKDLLDRPLIGPAEKKKVAMAE